MGMSACVPDTSASLSVHGHVRVCVCPWFFICKFECAHACVCAPDAFFANLGVHLYVCVCS